MKNKKVSILVLIIALSLVLYFTLKDDFSGITYNLSKVNILFFVIAILVFIISLLLKSVSLNLFLKDYKKDYGLLKSFKLILISQFLNGVTPFQTGGQPFEIYILRKDGIRISDSTSAILKDFISYQISLILVGLFAIIINHDLNFIEYNKLINLLLIFGFLINVLVLVFIILIVNAKLVVIKLTKKLFGFFGRFKVMNKVILLEDNVLKGLDNFYSAGNDIKKDKVKLFKAILCNITSLLLLYIIPFVVYVSLNAKNITLLNSIVSVSFVMIIGNFIPIPGATGGVEYSFLQFFGTFVKNPVLSSGMLLWRFITYILGMIIGFIALILDKRILNKKERSILIEK